MTLLSRQLRELLTGAEADLSDDVLGSLVRRSLSESFGGLLGEGELSALAAALDRSDAPGLLAGPPGIAELSRAVYERFTEACPRSQVGFQEFERGFARFVAALTASVEQARAPKLIDLPSRDFGELDLDEIARMKAPEGLSQYMGGLVKYFKDRGVIASDDAEHVTELIEKMVSAPGYLRFLSKEKKYQEVVRLFGIVRDAQSSGLRPGPALDDLMVSLGILLFNISPSEKIASYLASLRPSTGSDALLYHYNAILSLNHMLTGRLDLASAYTVGALRRALDHDKTAYIMILQGCIAIRQGDYDRAIAILKDASVLAPPGRMSGLIAFYRGVVLSEKKEYTNAIACFEAAGRHVDDPLDQATVQNNIGSCAMEMGDISRAERAFASMERLSRLLKDEQAARCRLTASSFMGAVWQARGDHRKAIEEYNRALNMAISADDRRAAINQLGNLGASYARVGDMNRAAQLLNTCMVYSERMGYWAGIKFAYWHISRLLAENGRWPEAARFVETYVSRYPELRDLR